MKILIDIQTIKGNFTYRGPIRIKIKLGDSVSIWTEFAHYNEGMYAFLEKHLISINQKSTHSYVQLSIVGQNGNVYGQITVFLDKFKDFNSIEIKKDLDSYKLAYNLKEIMDDSQQIELKSQRASKTIEAEPPNMNEQANKLQIFRLGILMYNFAQRLDPLVYVYNKIVSIIVWKDPLFTVAIGVFLTIVIYYLKTSILLGGIALYFGKQTIFKKISTIHKYKNFHKRIIVPKQNAFFLQNGMDNYCELYQKVTGFLFNDDKTLLINLIKFICKTCIAMILLLYLFSIQSIIIISIWTVLILTSPQKHRIKNLIKPIFTILIGEFYKISDKISEGISNMMGSQSGIEQEQIQKVFYFYQYERWWVLKGWCDETKKFSDQNYEAIIFPRQRAPEGWGWIQEWKIEFQSEMDSQGYQYSNDLMTEFVNKSALMTRRRRKWKRTCVKLRDTA